jgi:DNA processing protein
VEAHEHPAELLHARLAAAAGTPVAAVPGRVSASAARGPHQLLRDGALLVSDPQDVLDALYGVGVQRAAVSRPAQGGRLQAVLEQVGSGNDTVAKLTAGEALTGTPAQEMLVALAELELGGAVARGDGGRYVVCM